MTTDLLLGQSLNTEHLMLQRITPELEQDHYVGWLNDPEINRFTEFRHKTWTMADVTSYVDRNKENPYAYHMGIIYRGPQRDQYEHIGNIKLLIDPNHNAAEVSYLIGEKRYWGRGCATEAVRRMVRFAFEKCEVRYVWAGVYRDNEASARVLEKSGMRLWGSPRPERFLLDGKPQDHLAYWIKPEWFDV